MADRIKLLTESVANQIAAGEVVNRPSSVVKELLENAVDAGGKNITVNFRDGGKALIQVIDDGCGMSPVDARLAFDRHATSKISDVDDIYQLSSFGFRGEALASIGSVAEVELGTRQQTEELGTRVMINGGRFVSQEPVNCPAGSRFSIKNLFYNVPARRRFLEKSTTEARHILAEYQRVALCHPDIAFTLYDNDSLLSKLPASGLSQRVVGVIGKNIAKNLLEVSADTSIVKITGFAGRPASSRQSNREQFLFVNGRYFKSAYFNKAIVSAYEKLIPSNTQPSYFIYLTIDPQSIDVNVHPQKTEVKFSDGSDIWQIINAAVRESLAKSGAVPSMDFELDTSVEIPVFKERVTYKAPEIKANPDFNPFEKYGEQPKGRTSRTDLTSFMRDYDRASYEHGGADGPPLGENITREDGYEESVMEYIQGEDAIQRDLEMDSGTTFGGILPIGERYFATVSEEGLVLVDIFRAREAVSFDRYYALVVNGKPATQQLLFPERITFSMDDISLLREYIGDFTAFGFDISFADEHTIEIKGLPADMQSAPSEELIYELLDTVRDGSGDSNELRRRRIAAAMARSESSSRSFKSGTQKLAVLLEQLVSCSNPSYTPSGHAVMTLISGDEIGKRLK